jgi:Cu/Ag efflux pump CusA
MIGLSSDTLSPIDKSVIARWTIQPRLMGVPGVANVAVWGMRDQQLQVQVDPELVMRGAKERLAPILMTASATGLALVPLAVAGNLPGHEIEHPMAIVILGGLITATLLNLFVLPSLYLRFGKGRTT